jgi:HD-like signal output (HDOD) protein/CheY-like chemotaxis protein
MANVLLIDESEVARKALRGILTRGNHRLATVGTAEEAWQFLRSHVKVDLVFLELGPRSGVDFVRRLREDCFLKFLPVAIYATQADRGAVRAATELAVQNFLVKPYDDGPIYAEVKRALLNPWRQRLFEEEKAFCALLGISIDDHHRSLHELQAGLEAAGPFLGACAVDRDGAAASTRLAGLAYSAEAAGAWGTVETLAGLQSRMAAGEWDHFAEHLSDLAFAARMIFERLHPGFLPEPLRTDQERAAEREIRERDLWFGAEGEGRFPVVRPAEIQRRLVALAGCPVVDSAAAMFHMLADGHPSSLIPIMERVEKDPGLAAQVLIAANRSRRDEEGIEAPIDDLRLAVELLGEIKLVQLAQGLVTLEERLLHALPFTWPRFWMFQIAVARMAGHVCDYLELPALKGQAYTAGLLHDLGKLLVAYLYPVGWQAILAYARQHGVSTAQAERTYLGCTARELADQFAQQHRLPDCYRHVMRFLEKPHEADGSQDLVAVVALARDLCRRNHVGHDGDQPHGHGPPLEETRAWSVLGPRIFTGFQWEPFETEMHARCQEIKRELHGWVDAPAI